MGLTYRDHQVNRMFRQAADLKMDIDVETESATARGDYGSFFSVRATESGMLDVFISLSPTKLFTITPSDFEHITAEQLSTVVWAIARPHPLGKSIPDMVRHLLRD